MLRWLRYMWIDREMFQLLREQQEIIREQKRQMKRLELEGARAHLNALLGWRISQEIPEEDYRDRLDEGIERLTDKVARLEEHVT